MIPKQLETIIGKYDEKSREMVLSAYAQAEEMLKDRTRGNGSPFIEHPLAVATIVDECTGLMADAVTAVFLHEANRFQGENAAQLNSSDFLERCKSLYPKEIIDIVTSLNNISFIRLQEANLDEERYRKLVISYSKDPRVILIKLADRLEIIRNIGILPPAKRRAKLVETMALYTPLTHQLGLTKIQRELEDLFLKYSERAAYLEINRKLKQTEKDREILLENFINPLKIKLDAEGIKYTLKIRTKSAFSIWKKMKAQQLEFEQIFDIFAIRFIIDAPPEKEKEHELCWKVYSLVTEEYKPDTSRLRDWLSKPRENGYESLHTTVTNSEGAAVEVQIRTQRMDIEAEQGSASHWSYKGIKSEGSLTEWLNHVRNLLSSPEKSDYENIPLTFDEILVYTPSGDLRQLPKDASLLDFAFEIHSNLGLKCTGGRINGKMASIREKLHTGDIVEILSSKNQKPSEDWLSFTVTSKARAKIRQKLKEEENKRAAIGKELLARRLKNWKLTLSDEDLNEFIRKNKYRTVNEFYGAVGDGHLDPIEIKEFLTQTRQAVHIEEERSERAVDIDAIVGKLVISKKLQGVSLKMAKCCNPAYGDPVFGFLTIKDGIKIHRDGCPNAARLKTNYPYRLIEVHWKEPSDGTKTDSHKGRKGQ